MHPKVWLILLIIPHFLLADSMPVPDRFNLGKPASQQEIEKMDIDVRPDGQGLPKGKGNPRQGKLIYEQQCMACHGKNGEGGINDRLAGRLPEGSFPFAEKGAPKKTIGNYWPYATTLYDYVRRTMPYMSPGSLSNEEVYHVTAYLLYLNEIITEEQEITEVTLPEIEMPAHFRFVNDNRMETNKVR